MKQVNTRWLTGRKSAAACLITTLSCSVGIAKAEDYKVTAADFKPEPMLPYDVVENPVVIKEMLKSNLIAQIPLDQIIKAHQLFDLFSWRTFIALNWPAKENGEPDTSKSIGDKDKDTWRVWNHWRAIDSLFLPNGEKPTPWDSKLYHSKRHATVPNRKNSNYNPNSVVEALDNFKPAEPYYFIALLQASLPKSVIVDKSAIKLINSGKDNDSAKALAASTVNAYYYNQSLQTVFIKVFDIEADATVSTTFN